MRNRTIPASLVAPLALFSAGAVISGDAGAAADGSRLEVVCEEAAAALPGHEAADPGTVLDGLVGSWEGEGTLFGRPAAFRMIWEPELDGRFLGLSYEIRGDVVMSARVHYRLGDGAGLSGVWVDSRGEILELEAIAAEGRLITTWHSPSETGRTVYRLDTADSLVVCDFVADGEGWRLFGIARYVRGATGRMRSSGSVQ